jgi:DNA/RNA-binding domain of Phe-tRNA-synthetase-like protein
VRAGGDEPFETTAAGEPVLDPPEPGEVVRRDDAGVTCRRWNWRQTTRTRLTTATTRAVFVLDALGPMSDDALAAAGDALVTALTTGSPQATVDSRTV